ncbi:hypothetical protein EYC80_001667 [Monilinia laxa]|uniref:Uncharacterized protein n=1 Tax=Monilinia laxa TaxID=61186 RepID=A0A5N6K5L8_MONLA|nr:hypothetical protein EYC80_001667 [Monilinia laxa]
MCQFEYQRFQKCGHKGIEIIEYCNEVFWRAGMTGYLIPCPEQNFRAFFIRVGILDGLDFGTCLWVGLSGYCKLCEEEYGMPKAVPFRTYSDLKFLEGIGGLTSPILAVKLAEPIAYPNPPQSTKYSSTPNDGVTKEILDYEIAKSPSPLHEATPGIGENLLTRRLRTSLHHPYIFAPYIRNTVAGLISVEDQDTPNGLEDLYFPGKLQWYELDQGVDGTTLQWRSRGYHEGKMLEGPPSQYFHGHAGMTLADEQYVVNKLKDGVPLRIIWRWPQSTFATSAGAATDAASDAGREAGTDKGTKTRTVDATDDTAAVGAAAGDERMSNNATAGRTTTADATASAATNAAADSTADDANTRIRVPFTTMANLIIQSSATTIW